MGLLRVENLKKGARHGVIALAMLCARFGTAFADTDPSSISWSDLSAGDDWSAQVLDSLFPMTSGGSTAAGTMLQYISAYVMLIAAFWITYGSVVQLHRTAESGKILSAHFSGWAPIRIVMSVALMVPVASNNGFSVGQAILVQDLAKPSIGMARNLNNVVAKAVGPDALPIAEPIIPGTRQVVMAVMESELCRALVGAATHNPLVAPEPSVVNPGGGAAVTVDYKLSSGNASGTSVCGSIRVSIPSQEGQHALGTTIDLSDVSAQQVTALKSLIEAVRPPMETLATTLWQTRDATALRAMDAVLVSANTAYSAALTSAASTAVSKIRAQYSDGASSTTDSGYLAMKNLGWTGLGAYYLEISRLNSEVLAVASIVPSVTHPNWQGLGHDLMLDLAASADAIERYQATEEKQLAAADSPSAPNGAMRLYHNGEIPDSAESGLDKALQAVGVSNGLMTLIVNHLISPTSGTGWTDPLGAMITLGHILIHTALAIIGGAAIASSKTASGLATAANLVTGDLPAAAASATTFALSGLIKALLTPIFAGAFLLLGPGITLAYVLPMTPFAYWTVGVAGWYLVVIEAVVGFPLWMLAHMVFKGDGLHGGGLRGYEVLFTIIFRPVMMIAGLIFSYTVFAAISWLIMKGFTVATGFVFDHGWLLDNMIGLIVLLCMFVTMEMSLAVMAFRLISTLPHHIPAMAGMTSIGRVDSDDFSDKSTGQGLSTPTEKAAGLARDTAVGLGNGGNGPENIDKAGAPPVDSATRSLMMIAGQEEE
ncbi:DotA/TraY family protein [Gluconacetobacter sp. 1b LMG 1731]|uniref:DotA/TraY family protein n=1 Tax=Gluconacetobacter dulcium TaxID=2729096 RepID=A0A7W4NUF7_9PROT|nr:DotA/TraY family protein [Gluconacetobacter dulcium]MBB2166557.1 DotA/TraY family protein [Gluconacetobacter dulcium]MBB2195659.1 DotA/TraY family protein [Gluconacetobacter dulcium]